MKYPRLFEAIQVHRVNFPAFSSILWRLSDHTTSSFPGAWTLKCEKESGTSERIRKGWWLLQVFKKKLPLHKT